MTLNELPKFLLADDANHREFLIHCHYPKFIMEVDKYGIGDVVFIDPEADYINLELKAGREPAQSLSSLIREAGDFFHANWH